MKEEGIECIIEKRGKQNEIGRLGRGKEEFDLFNTIIVVGI